MEEVLNYIAPDNLNYYSNQDFLQEKQPDQENNPCPAVGCEHQEKGEWGGRQTSRCQVLCWKQLRARQVAKSRSLPGAWGRKEKTFTGLGRADQGRTCSHFPVGSVEASAQRKRQRGSQGDLGDTGAGMGREVGGLVSIDPVSQPSSLCLWRQLSDSWGIILVLHSLQSICCIFLVFHAQGHQSSPAFPYDVWDSLCPQGSTSYSTTEVKSPPFSN